jgi:DNA repair protein RecO
MIETMETLRQEAIILKTYPFKDRQSIAAALTKDKGLIRMIVTSSKTSPCPDPLTEVECILLRGSSELIRCKEITTLYHHIPLRQSYPLLDLALRMGLMILQLQPAEDTGEGLYRLLCSFLRQLPQKKDYLFCMEACFIIKLLKHEGSLTPLSHCSICKSLDNLALDNLELFCPSHSPQGSLSMTDYDIETLNSLFSASSFQELHKRHVGEDFVKKTQRLFDDYIKR